MRYGLSKEINRFTDDYGDEVFIVDGRAFTVDDFHEAMAFTADALAKMLGGLARTFQMFVSTREG